MARKRAPRTDVPPAFRNQLQRLFGPDSVEANNPTRSATEWKRTCNKILVELEKYLLENVQTDDVHLLMIYSGIISARESLKQDDFWPGYTEGVTRVAFLLMGDYPDHRRRKGKAKSKNYYNLKRFRNLHYIQNDAQKYWTLNAADGIVGPLLSKPVRTVLDDFRLQYGFEPSISDFIRWYRENYPEDYATVF